MHIEYLETRKQLKAFKNFIRLLYEGDNSYVSTCEFVLNSVLYKETDFIKRCVVLPVAVTKNGNTYAQAIFIYAAELPYLQIGFFDALENAKEAVELLIKEAKSIAARLKLSRIVIGLNAHISYGVGILTEGFDFKNSFDSIYNKPYYKNFFTGFDSASLSTYRMVKKNGEKNLPHNNGRIIVSPANLKDFYAETEKMRELCEKTIAKTFLYFPTKRGHFYELMKDLRPFLSNENLLFAKDESGKLLGFLFWHPDFNRIIPSGKSNSLLSIGLRFAFCRNKIDTAKINAIGSLSPRATCALIEEFSRITSDRFIYAETNFVWDNNLKSTLINQSFFGNPHRKYEVYFTNV